MKLIKLFSYIILFGYLMSAKAMLAVVDPYAVAQLIKQLIQLKEQTQYIKQQLQVLKSGEWAKTQDLMNELGGIVNQTNGIAYSATNINQRFRESYPGYREPQDYDKQYQDNVNQTQNTLNGVLQSMGASARDFQNENSRLTFLQHQSQSAQGQTQAIQAGNQISSEMVSQIELLRQTMIAQSNAQTTYYATQIQNEASIRAEQNAILNRGNKQIIPYGTSGNYLEPPNI